MSEVRRVVIVGSGAADLAAALAASQNGLGVTVIEQASVVGGTTAYSGGVAWIPNSTSAKSQGVRDSPGDALRYLGSIGLGDFDEAACRRFVEAGPSVIDQIESVSRLRWAPIDWPDYHSEFPGGRAFGRSLEIDALQVPSSVLERVRRDPHKPSTVTYRELAAGSLTERELQQRAAGSYLARGRGLVGGLYEACLDLGVKFVFEERARRLVTVGERVVGVETSANTYAGPVVLASGGFERNHALVRHFLRAPMKGTGSAPGMNGDGLLMGMAVGAQLGNMSEAWWCPTIQLPDDDVDGEPLSRMLFSTFAHPGGILVDKVGRRFANEGTNYNDLGRSLHAFDPSEVDFPCIPAWYVFDATRRAARPVGPLSASDADPAWLERVDSLQALGDVVGPKLLATIERYNTFADIGRDPDFGRGSRPMNDYLAGTTDVHAQLRPIACPPFYAMRVMPGTLGTKGGLKTNSSGQVLRAVDDGPIPGLYAAGNAAANIFGFGYPGGGGTIGPALTFGWLSGAAASAEGG